MHASTHTYTHVYISILIHTHVHTYTHTHIHTHTHTCTRTHTHVHACTHIHIHKLTYTYTHTVVWELHVIHFPVTLIVRPTISLEVFNYTHFIDETAILPCPVDSNPYATFEWRLGTSMAELQLGSKYQVDHSDGTLTITRLRLSDSNVYHCIATNYLSSDTATTTIIVEGIYSIICIHCVQLNAWILCFHM